MQSFTYTGEAATTRTLGGMLAYSQLITGDYRVGAGVFAAHRIFRLSATVVEVGATAESIVNALFDPTAFPGYLELGAERYNVPTSTDGRIANLSVTVLLNPGDKMWVWTLLQTAAVNGGWANADSFVTGWNDTTGLTPAVVAVPEPTTSVLVGLGLAALALARRRARR